MLRASAWVQVPFSLLLDCNIGLVCLGAGTMRAQQPVVEKLILDDTIQPVSAGMLERAIARANADAPPLCW